MPSSRPARLLELAARGHRRPARVRVRLDQGGAPGGGAARRGVRDHRPDRRARPDRWPIWFPRSTRPWSTGVLTDSANGLAFRHPLIRDALYAEMPTSVRAVWHRDAGHALAAVGTPPSASPWAAAARSGRRRAGLDDGLARLRRPTRWSARPPGVAAELLARAVDSIPAGSATHGWLACCLADALYPTGDLAAAERVAERALGHTTDPDLIVDLHWTLTQGRIIVGLGRRVFCRARPGAGHSRALGQAPSPAVGARRAHQPVPRRRRRGRPGGGPGAHISRRRRTTPGRPAGR